MPMTLMNQQRRYIFLITPTMSLSAIVGILGILAACGQVAAFSTQAPKEGTQISSNIAQPAPKPTPTAAPLPEGAIVQGSFTVFANPSHPKEGQDYDIHIRVKLPPNTSTYLKNDLSGTVHGTDGFSHEIGKYPGAQFEKFSFIAGSETAELVILIPGTYAGVDDTLQVTSKLLKETQPILIHFG